MRLFLIGITLTAVSVVALVIASRRPDATPADGPLRTARTMVWKATRGESKAVVWICGSIHVLREEDYPLPEPWRKAWSESLRVVMELPPGSTEQPETQKRTMALASLPEGRLLDELLSLDTRTRLDAWAAESGFPLTSVRNRKPWMAALSIGMHRMNQLGFNVARGIERHFGARMGDRLGEGLETVEQSLGLLDSLPAAQQEQLILQAIEDARTADRRIATLANAWHEGDTDTLDRLLREGFKNFPELRRRLIDDRNKAWLPRLLELLDGDEPTIVIVGCGHLAGPDSLIALLAARGVTLTQQEHTTRRPLPPPAP